MGTHGNAFEPGPTNINVPVFAVGGKGGENVGCGRSIAGGDFPAREAALERSDSGGDQADSPGAGA